MTGNKDKKYKFEIKLSVACPCCELHAHKNGLT
jgi:hypothetical protein